jgi:hypothetical protein
MSNSPSSSSASSSSSSASSSADAASATGGGSSSRRQELTSLNALGLCKRISKKLTVGIHDSISCADHKRAGECMLQLKNMIMEPDQLDIDQECKVSLTCTGVHLFKRIVCGDESDEIKVDLKQTLALVFVLIVLLNRPRSVFAQEENAEDAVDVEMEEVGKGLDEEEEKGNGEGEGEEVEDPRTEEENFLGGWESGCILDMVMESEEQLAVADDLKDLKKPRATSLNVCKMCLVVADQQADVLTMDKLTTLAEYFFSQSSHAMSLQLFNGISKPGDDFLTLSSMSFLAAASSANSTKLSAIADIAESESGQAVLRDLILSFTLPRNVVGVRKTCLLTRKANNRATKEHPLILGEAHEAAMRGAEYSFADDPKIIHKICALLAGIAVILTKNAQSIRRDDAFQGRVSLPFLETKLEKRFEFMPRLHYISDSNDWVVYKMSSKTGMPIVEFRGGGYEGCCQACLLFMNSVDT